MLGKFDPYEKTTWNRACNTPFIVDNNMIYNFDTGKPISEIELVKILDITLEIARKLGSNVSEKIIIENAIKKLVCSANKGKLFEKGRIEYEKGKKKILLAERITKKSGKCWKCGADITAHNSNYECIKCGYITYFRNGKEFDEYEYWGKNEPIGSITDKYDYSLINQFGMGYSFERTFNKIFKSTGSKYDCYYEIFKSLINEENEKPRINYSKLAKLFNTLARFQFDTKNYFYEALDCASAAEIQNVYENADFNDQVFIEYKCMNWCNDIKKEKTEYQVKELLKKRVFPLRSCSYTEFFDYEDGYNSVEKVPIGYCVAYMSSNYNYEIKT